MSFLHLPVKMSNLHQNISEIFMERNQNDSCHSLVEAWQYFILTRQDLNAPTNVKMFQLKQGILHFYSPGVEQPLHLFFKTLCLLV